MQDPPALIEAIDQSRLNFYGSRFARGFRIVGVDGDSAAVGINYASGFYTNVNMYVEIDTLGNSLIDFSSEIEGNDYCMKIFSSNDVDSVSIEENVKEGIRGIGYWCAYTQRNSDYKLSWPEREGRIETERVKMSVNVERGSSADTTVFRPGPVSRRMLREFMFNVTEKAKKDIATNRLRMLSKRPGFMGRKIR